MEEQKRQVIEHSYSKINVPRSLQRDIDEWSSITTVEKVDRDEYGADWKIEITTDGGAYATFGRDSKYRIKSVALSGEPDTITLWVIERSY
jgi:lipocalin